MMVEWRGYSTFKDVPDITIRAWNRITTIFNITENNSREMAEEYLSLFNKDDRTSIAILLAYTSEKGKDYVAREIQRNFSV